MGAAGHDLATVKGRLSRRGVCGGIEEVKIGMDVADVRECHEQRIKKGQCGRNSSLQGKTITNGMNRRN